MTYYQKMTKEEFQSTAIYPNRLREKEFLDQYGLEESGEPQRQFQTMFGSVVAIGYLRIVYGDHGAYIEFSHDHIKWPEWECERQNIGYFNKWYPTDGANTLLYDQRSDVRNLENPPSGFQGNRPEGYADYRAGRCYISPYDLIIGGK